MAPKLIRLAVGAFVGDVYCDGDAKIANSGFWAFKKLRSLLGFVSSGKEGRIRATVLTLLGAEVSLACDATRAQASTQRVLKIKGHIAQALHINFLTPSSASKLWGGISVSTPPC